MEPLKYNRAGAVYFNFEELNRIENWCSYLADHLAVFGYFVKMSTKTWDMSSIPYQTEIDRIRRNICSLQNGFYALPDWREITFTNSLDFTQVNALEWDLRTIYVWLERMITAFCYSGETYSGEGFA